LHNFGNGVADLSGNQSPRHDSDEYDGAKRVSDHPGFTHFFLFLHKQPHLQGYKQNADSATVI